MILKENRVFAVSDAAGDIPLGNELGLGLYHLDTRFLSGFELRLNGSEPILLSSSVDRAYVATFQLVNPTLSRAGGGSTGKQTLSLRRTRFILDGLLERVGLQNCNQDPVELSLDLAFDADFKDIFEVRGYQGSEALGTVRKGIRTEYGFRFRYEGKDSVRRETEIIFNSSQLAPVVTGEGRISFPVKLQAQERFQLLIDILPLVGNDTPPPDFDFENALCVLEDSYTEWNKTCTSFRSNNEILDSGILWRSREDLRVLCDDLPTGPYPTAGIPWYAVPFGRDGIITSIQTLALNPDLAYGTLGYLAAHQGTVVDPSREEEPGKIFHEIRFGELANLHLIPHTPYYGSVDATPLFLCLLVEVLDWTGDVDLLTRLTPNMLAALKWCDEYGDLDGDGFIEYQQHSQLGVRNQGWKDSADSLTHADGSIAELPAALCEVQGYVYQAKAGLARIFAALGRAELAERLGKEASELKRRFNEAFWVPAESFYAQGLDGGKRQVTPVSSNPGHCLWSGIIDRQNAAAVAHRLLAPDMFSGWGIRTLSSTAVNYNPMSYHNGSIWPHDNSIVAAGLRRYGFSREAEMVARSILEAGMRFADSRLPELFCGFTRDLRFNSRPGEYLVSCNPQAWGSGAAFHMLTTLLGIDVDLFGRRMRIAPLETSLFRRLHVCGLRVGEQTIDFTVDQRHGAPTVSCDRPPVGITMELPA